MPVEVYNMGIPGIGPKDYLSLFVKEGLAYEPDMLLLSFFIGNDFKESEKRKLHEYSHVFSLLHYLINFEPQLEGRTYHGRASYCDDCPNFSRDRYLEIESKRSGIYLKGNERFQDILGRALYYLGEIHNICVNKGIKLVVVIIPDEIQINAALLRDVQAQYFSDVAKDHWDMTLPNRRLSEALHKLHIDYIDLYQYYAVESPIRLYRPQDSHWNIAGNQLAAHVISGKIRGHLKD